MFHWNIYVLGIFLIIFTILQNLLDQQCQNLLCILNDHAVFWNSITNVKIWLEKFFLVSIWKWFLLMISKFKIFNHKERFPSSCMSSVVYTFSYASCDVTYLGSTRKKLICRIQQHAALFFWTNLPLGRPKDSSIRSLCQIRCTLYELNKYSKILNS